METYQHAAKREYELLLANHRQANRLVTVKYYREFTNLQVIAIWSVLKAILTQHDIIAYVVIEITTRRHIYPNGEYRDYPINKVHYHLLVDSNLLEIQLRYIFNQSCLDAGLAKDKFEVLYEEIHDRKTFERKVKYILKFDIYAEQAILFKRYTGINKVDMINTWFINADGTRANKDKMWKAIVDGWYPNQPENEPPQPIRITIRLSASIQIRNLNLNQ